MFARIGTWQGTHEALEDWVARATQDVKPHLQQDPGLKAGYWLVDHDGAGL
jgi:hypothetical protein